MLVRRLEALLMHVAFPHTSPSLISLTTAPTHYRLYPHTTPFEPYVSASSGSLANACCSSCRQNRCHPKQQQWHYRSQPPLVIILIILIIVVNIIVFIALRITIIIATVRFDHDSS